MLSPRGQRDLGWLAAGPARMHRKVPPRHRTAQLQSHLERAELV